MNSIATEQIPIAQEEIVSTELASESFKTNDLSDFYSKTIPVKPLEAATPDLSDFYSKTAKSLFFRAKQICFLFEVEQSNVGDRLKRVLPKFEVCTASV